MRRRLALLAVAALALAALAAGCAKRSAVGTETGGAAVALPLSIIEELEETLPGGQENVKLVVRGDAGAGAVEALLRRYVEEHRRPGRELWVAVFLEGMDLQAIEYAFARARPGQPVQVTVRESAQTYR